MWDCLLLNISFQSPSELFSFLSHSLFRINSTDTSVDILEIQISYFYYIEQLHYHRHGNTSVKTAFWLVDKMQSFIQFMKWMEWVFSRDGHNCPVQRGVHTKGFMGLHLTCILLFGSIIQVDFSAINKWFIVRLDCKSTKSQCPPPTQYVLVWKIIVKILPTYIMTNKNGTKLQKQAKIKNERGNPCRGRGPMTAKEETLKRGKEWTVSLGFS